MSEYKNLIVEIEESQRCKWSSYDFVQDDRSKFYCLSMMPFSSGDLHMGHVRNYTFTDCVARRKILEGFNVLHPMGWDAFGLPAENAAFKNNLSPKTWTDNNVQSMKKQLNDMGLLFSWNRELQTSNIEYYRLQQILFIQMWHAGIIKREETSVYWDPVDQTVLAREQVIDGKGWRSGAPIEKKTIKTWVIDVQPYAASLRDDLDSIESWSPALINAQKQWIGRKTGHRIDFKVDHVDNTVIQVFTTAVTHLFYADYLALGIDHSFVKSIVKDNITLQQFRMKWGSVCEARERIQAAVVATGYHAFNPLLNTRIPIYVTNVVDSQFGTGAIMGCPATCATDREIADAIGHNYDKAASDQVINPYTKEMMEEQLYVSSSMVYRLRNWSISRQRKWGCPIPMIECPKCGDVSSCVPITVLDQPTAVKCPICQGPAQQDPDTMDTFVCSSWYYARFCSLPDSHAVLDDHVSDIMPVDCYVGGIEHATLHLLYARLVYRILKQLGYINSEELEPFNEMINQGMIYYKGSKMSKSQGNVVSPKKMITKYGNDALRLFMFGKSPITKSIEWSENDIIGYSRLLERIFNLCLAPLATDTNDKDGWYTLCNDTLRHFANHQLNIVVSYYFKMIKHIGHAPSKEQVHDLLLLLHPCAPHISSYLWTKLYNTNILDQKFCKHRPTTQQTKTTILIDNKYHGSITGDVEPYIAKLSESLSIKQIYRKPDLVIIRTNEKR